MPLRNTVAFPFTILPSAVSVSRSVKLIEDAQNGDRLIGLVSMKDPEIEEPVPGQTYETGTVARIERVMELPWNSFSEDQTDIDRAHRVLDEDRYGLHDAGTTWLRQKRCKVAIKSKISNRCMYYIESIYGHCDCLQAQLESRERKNQTEGS